MNTRFKIVQKSDSLKEKELEKLADEGWELVAVTRINMEFHDHGREYYFRKTDAIQQNDISG